MLALGQLLILQLARKPSITAQNNKISIFTRNNNAMLWSAVSLSSHGTSSQAQITVGSLRIVLSAESGLHDAQWPFLGSGLPFLSQQL